MRGDEGKIVSILVILALIVVGVIFYQQGTVKHRTAKVEEKEAVHHGGGTKYLLYPEKGEPLENTDAMFHMKFNSSTIYGEIEEGECYRFEVYGWRLPFFSMYQNIIGKEEIKCEEIR